MHTDEMKTKANAVDKMCDCGRLQRIENKQAEKTIQVTKSNARSQHSVVCGSFVYFMEQSLVCVRDRNVSAGSTATGLPASS